MVLSEKLFRIAFRLMGDSAEAEDVVQDSIMKLWDIRTSLHKYNSIEAFTVTMVKNKCLDKLKAKGRNSVDIDNAYSLSNAVSPENQNETNENIAMINQIVNQLPEHQRLIIQLRDIEGYSFDDISQITGISINTLRVNLSRARKAVKEQLTKLHNYGLKQA